MQPDARTLHADLVACRRHSRGHSTTKVPWPKALLLARPTGACASTLIYAPDMDGQADPGEVVWVHSPNKQSDGRERAIVILGHHERYIRGLLISTNDEHSTDNNWLEIGAGGWDMQGRPAWVRLDKIIEVPDHMIRRKGTVLPRRRFERIASRLRTDYNWR